jgi:hypothetical protein
MQGSQRRPPGDRDQITAFDNIQWIDDDIGAIRAITISASLTAGVTTLDGHANAWQRAASSGRRLPTYILRDFTVPWSRARRFWVNSAIWEVGQQWVMNADSSRPRL